MTEPIAVDVPAKPLSALRSIASAIPPAPKPADKPPEPATKPPAPATPGKPSLLARFAARVTKKQAVIGASAVLSIVAGAASVRLLLPPDPDPQSVATQPLAPDPKPPVKPAAAEPGKLPGDTIPPASLPLPPAATPAVSVVPDTSAAVVPLPGTMRKPVAQLEPGPDPLAPAARPGDPVPRLGEPAPGRWGTGAGSTPAPEFDLPKTPVVPVGGNDQPKLPIPAAPAAPPVPPTGPGPTLPALPDLSKPAAPGAGPADMNPKLPDPGAFAIPPAGPSGTGGAATPKTPALPDPTADLLNPLPKGPPAPVAGSPPGGGPLVPVVPDGGPKVPAAPPDFGPMLPTTPVKPVGVGPDATPVGGAKLEFVKPANNPTATPAGGPERTPTTSYDVDIHHLKAGDTWETVSREFYNDARYAASLAAYNRNKPLRDSVDVPPLHVVKRYGANAGGAAVPVRSAEWVVPAAVRAGGDKAFRVPQGGMSMRAVARITLGSDQKWDDLHRLNPHLRADEILPAGTELRLPPDARLPD